MNAQEPLTGIDVPKVEAWITEHAPELVAPFRWTRLPGGHSNLTYRIEDQRGTSAVVRRPPMGELLPKAHDMNREYRIIEALWGTGVPVPRPYGYCPDPAVTGQPFYVMGFVRGEPLGGPRDAETWLPETLRATASLSFADTLAAMHAVDPVERGIGDLGRSDDFAGRQLKAWYRSWVTFAPDAELDDPRAHELHDFFQTHKPAEGSARLVHGDFGVHNVLVGETGHITAVLDWEVASLGEPLSDLAYLLNMWVEPAEVAERGPTMTALPGFLPRSAVLARYVEAAGPVDEQKLQYFVALNHWRTACIVHGVYARYKRGQKSSEGLDLSLFVRAADLSLRLSARAAALLR